MRAAVVIVAVALLAFASARCPNSCSGHGDCGGSDKCACWANWQGFDCSERTCEYDVAWATDARQNPHYYAECSGKGVCDRTTGLCACFDGYTGSACRRSVCPNDCSGHGKCRLIAELGDANSALSVESNGASTEGSLHQYGRWDGDKIQACVCDGGFFGPDCSQRNCPKGDDPLTICNAATQQVQTLTISSTYSTLVQNVDLAPPVAGLPIKGTFSLTAGGETASSLAASLSGANALATPFNAALTSGNAYKGATSSGSSPSWSITFASGGLAAITGSNAGLYSPTGAFSFVVDTSGAQDTLTVTIARTEPGTAVAGTLDITLDGGTNTLTFALGATVAATITNIIAAVGPWLTATGYTITTPATQIVAGAAGTHAEEGDIVFTFDGNDLAAVTPTSGLFDDFGSAYGTLPTLTVSSGEDGAFTGALFGSSTFQGELVLHFTDSEGEVWTTSRIGTAGDATYDFFAGVTNTRAAIASALAGIPNFKVPKVTVAAGTASNTAGSGVTSQGFDITFGNERNSGVQNLLACDPLPLGCQTAGCSPVYQQPKTWTTTATGHTVAGAHKRIEYARNPVANAFTNAGTWVDSVTGGQAVPGTAPSFTTLITDDSVFDNSGLDFDQATVLIRVYKVAYTGSTGNTNWGSRPSDAYAYYTVEWDYNVQGKGASTSLPSSSCGLDGSSCTIRYIPTGAEDISGGSSNTHTAVGSTDVGVGYDHAPIGNGLFVNFGSAIAGLSTANTYHEQLYIVLDVATVRCDVVASAPAPEYEHLECSGRGTCDRSTGTCTCFEGHYGDHCGMQTILV